MPQQSPPLSRRSLLAIAAMMTGGAAIGARSVFADPPEPVRHTKTSDATPVASDASPEWAALFDRAYDPGTGLAEQAAMIATFADFDAETAALGLTKPTVGASDDEIAQWTRRMPGLALPRDYAYVLTPEWKEYTGFDVAQVSQTMEIGEPPAVVALYLGRFDRAAVIDTWKAGGYEEIEDDGEIAIYSISEDESFDLSNPIQKVFLSRRNNAAIVGSELILFTSSLDLLREAVLSATGEAAPLAEAPGVDALLANTPQLASGAIVSGSSLQTLPVDIIGATPDEIATAIVEQQSQDQVPPILLALVGVTPGGPMPTLDFDNPDATPEPTPETATMELSLLMLTRDAAQQAIDVAGERLKTAVSVRTNRPFTEMFESWELSVAEDAPVARLSIALKDIFPKIWMDLLFSRDFPFLS